MNVLDLTFLSILRVDGKELPLLPGLLAQNPPSRPARGRDQDRLLVYLILTGNIGYSPSEYSLIAAQVAETFYSTPGSLTFALKIAITVLNTMLVDRNMKSTGKGLYSNAALVLCTLRGNSMYVVQSGPTHVYHLGGGETRHYYDPELAGKGLGLSQNARMFFSQVTLSPGDRLIMCAALPPNWDKSISELRSSASIETTRRRLLAITDANTNALLVVAANGSGVMNILKAVKSDTPEPTTLITPTLEITPGISPKQNTLLAGDLSEAELTSGTPVPEIVQRNPVKAEAPLEPASEPPIFIQPDDSISFGQRLRGVARFLARAIQTGRSFVSKILARAEKIVPYLFPDNDGEQSLKSVSQNTALFFALAIPVLLFVIARIVYYQLGYEAQYNLYYNRAQQSAQLAQVEKSQSAARVEWEAALDWLDKADPYQAVPNPEAQKFRLESQNALDRLDKVTRLDFGSAFDPPLSRNLHVSRISASDSEVYVLDSVTGSVLRGIYNGHNYDLDKSFQCEPGIYNKIEIGKLIDIIALPNSGSTNATLLGIDGSGYLIYCIPGEAPRASSLQLPGTGWSGITAIAYEDDTLFVLDAPARAVWFYLAEPNKIEFLQPPKIFFGEQVPIKLEQAIDLALNGADLYLLHKDGHLAACTFSYVAPTRCKDPALYNDTRPGYEGGINLTDGIFSQIAVTGAPNPSLALLAPFNQSIFRFSPQSLELQDQARAASAQGSPLPKGIPVTAMAFSPNKILFIYVDGQLYFSVNAP